MPGATPAQLCDFVPVPFVYRNTSGGQIRVPMVGWSPFSEKGTAGIGSKFLFGRFAPAFGYGHKTGSHFC